MNMTQIDEATLKLVMDALRKCRYRALADTIVDPAIAALQALAEQPVQQEPVAWPCVIAEADFQQKTITLRMQCSNYKVSAGTHYLSVAPQAQPAQRKESNT